MNNIVSGSSGVHLPLCTYCSGCSIRFRVDKRKISGCATGKVDFVESSHQCKHNNSEWQVNASKLTIERCRRFGELLIAP